MRPAKISQFMKWRDSQPLYQNALRAVLACTEEVERLEAQGREDAEVEARWKKANEALREVEQALLSQWEAKQ